MTNDEKAKAYDEALKKIQPLYEQAKKDDNPIWSTYEYIFPDLRESEDEKIRRTLVEYFGPEAQLDFIRGVPIQKIRDWLEKQKEQNSNDVKREWWNKGYLEGRKNAHIPARELGLPSSWDFQKEQKPELVQQPTITYAYNSNASRDERLKAALLALLNSDLLKVKEGGYFTKQDLIEWVERIQTDKPAWSEEDEMKIHFLSRLIEFQVKDDEYCFGEPFRMISKQEAIEMLKSLRPQPKQEWSEEDKETIELLIAILKVNHPNGKFKTEEAGATDVKYISTDEIISRIKALRPSWKPSEDEERLISTSISFLKDFADKGYENAVKCIDWLKSKLNGNSGK